ncbi:MAG TPA: hypothetical protein VGM69_26440 [Chloroflexota bacterium]
MSILLVACQPRLELEPTPRPTGQPPVVVASEGGRLPTRPAPRTPVPTPTTDLVALINTVVPFPTRTPGPLLSPTPILRPPVTSTPRQPPSSLGGSVPGPPAAAGAPPGSGGPAERTPSEPVAPPEGDALEPNDTVADAVPLDVGQEVADLTLHTPDDVDVFAVDVEEPDTTLVVTLSGRPPGRYKLDIAAPRGGNVGRQRVDGTVALRSVTDVGADLGRYYVHVRRVGALPVEGPYSISASLVGPTALPTVPP